MTKEISTPVMGMAACEAFENRAISPETAARFGIYTARKVGGNTIPHANGNIVVFPFLERGEVVNEKFRGPGKTFWQTKGGRKTFWNSDILDDRLLQGNSSARLVITEGELDALTAIDCGNPFVVSVPDGAPPALRPGEKLDPLDPTAEATGKFEFLFNNRDRLQKVNRFIIAVDNDPPGKRLAEELVRRLGPIRCDFVTYPEGCKDLNDVLMKHGRNEVIKTINLAQPYPVQGLYRLSDYHDPGPLQVYTSGWGLLDPHFKLYFPEFIVVTGVPSHGKSQFILNLVINQAQLHGFRACLFSPEEPTVPILRNRMRKIIGGSAEEADAYIENMFVFIDDDPISGEADHDLNWLLDRASDAVMRDGIRLLVIDPWNEIEHARAKNESGPEYIGRCIRLLKRWGKEHGVSVIIAAHPTKDVVDYKGKIRKPSLYDIDGAAHWFNKADHGIVIWRNFETHTTEFYIAKSREEDAGTAGSCTMKFERETGRFVPLKPDTPAMI